MKLLCKLPSLHLGPRWHLSPFNSVPSNPNDARNDMDTAEIRSSITRPHFFLDSVDTPYGFRQDELPVFQHYQECPGSQFRRPPSITALYRGRNEFVSHSRNSSLSRLSSQISVSSSAGDRPDPEPYSRLWSNLGSIPAIRRANDNRRYGLYIASPHYTPEEFAQQECEPIIPDTAPEPTIAVPQSFLNRIRDGHPRRQRQPTYRAENENSVDPPPQYSARDPNPLFGDLNSGFKFKIHVIDTIRQIGLKHTTEKVGRSVVKGMEDVGKVAKDMPKAVKGAQVQLRIKRAKGKIRWLEKHDFLSGQDRLLGQELRG